MTTTQRMGLEIQRYLQVLWSGQRLILRGAVEEIRERSGLLLPRFTELASLGGRSSLRGYPHGRWRDQAAMLLTAEWRVSAGSSLEATFFADAGRVMPRIAEIAVGGLHTDFGIGLQIEREGSHLMRLQLAGGGEGFRLWLTLEPLFDRYDRRDRES